MDNTEWRRCKGSYQFRGSYFFTEDCTLTQDVLAYFDKEKINDIWIEISQNKNYTTIECPSLSARELKKLLHSSKDEWPKEGIGYCKRYLFDLTSKWFWTCTKKTMQNDDPTFKEYQSRLKIQTNGVVPKAPFEMCHVKDEKK